VDATAGKARRRVARKAFEQSRRVLRRHTERRAERGGGDQRSRGEDVLSCPFYVVTPKSRRET
jgi:hypothetical protein